MREEEKQETSYTADTTTFGEGTGILSTKTYICLDLAILLGNYPRLERGQNRSLGPDGTSAKDLIHGRRLGCHLDTAETAYRTRVSSHHKETPVWDGAD